jgi:biopolymer transport protein ExbD
MGTRRRKRKRMREVVSSELELMPMLNVFLAIIPLLLLSAAFTPVTVIPASLPADGSQGAPPATSQEPLDLVVRILPDQFVVQGNGIELRRVPRPQAAHDDPAAKDARTQLATMLQEIAAARPDQHDVRIVSESGTRYEDIIDAMDAARGAGFSDAALCDNPNGAE